MIRTAIMLVLTVGSALFVSDVVKEVKANPPATETHSTAVSQSGSIDPSGEVGDLGSALRFVGVCSVVCSVIGGTVLITVSRRRVGRIL